MFCVIVYWLICSISISLSIATHAQSCHNIISSGISQWRILTYTLQSDINGLKSSELVDLMIYLWHIKSVTTGLSIKAKDNNYSIEKFIDHPFYINKKFIYHPFYINREQSCFFSVSDMQFNSATTMLSMLVMFCFDSCAPSHPSVCQCIAYHWGRYYEISSKWHVHSIWTCEAYHLVCLSPFLSINAKMLRSKQLSIDDFFSEPAPQSIIVNLYECPPFKVFI